MPPSESFNKVRLAPFDLIALVLLLVIAFGVSPAFADDELKKECKFALLVGFGKTDKEEKTSETSIDQVKGNLIDRWGFPAPLVRTKLNQAAGRKDILGQLDEFETMINERDPAKLKVDACYVKIHLQGHGHYGKPGDDKDVKPPVTPPDKEDHHAYDTAGGGHIWDFEVEERLRKLSDLLKKKGFKKQALIVQADFCWSETIFGKLTKDLPANVHLAWSADKNHTCRALVGEGHATPFTEGFSSTFGGEKPPSVEEAHKGATTQKDAKGNGAGYKDGDPKTPVNPADK
jgi:hypothetical protein